MKGDRHRGDKCNRMSLMLVVIGEDMWCGWGKLALPWFVPLPSPGRDTFRVKSCVCAVGSVVGLWVLGSLLVSQGESSLQAFIHAVWSWAADHGVELGCWGLGSFLPSPPIMPLALFKSSLPLSSTTPPTPIEPP
jgi:hypothetical protein